MAKRKDLLLTEATTMRMMGLAGLKPLASSFLKEEQKNEEPPYDPGMGAEHALEKPMEESYGEEEMDEGICKKCGDPMCEGSCMEENLIDSYEEEDDEEEDEEEYEEEYEEEDELEEAGLVYHQSSSSGRPLKRDFKKKEKEIKESLKRLKRLLEQAGAPPLPSPEPPKVGAMPPPPEGEMPPPVEGGGDEMESKIKEFVKKLGQLVQETLGVEVTVEESGEEKAPEGEGEMPPPPPGGAAGAATAPPAAQGMMAEAINRLVNKVARRVKARLMEAKKEGEKKKGPSKRELKDLESHYGEEMRMGIKGKHSHQSRMKALKEKQAAAKKREMMMKKKKAAMAKRK